MANRNKNPVDHKPEDLNLVPIMNLVVCLIPIVHLFQVRLFLPTSLFVIRPLTLIPPDIRPHAPNSLLGLLRLQALAQSFQRTCSFSKPTLIQWRPARRELSGESRLPSYP